jgi:hypothetical protein|tara:strand:+ start:1883 stop:2353 length:471 start_codon:yes stop_codon:yes gene_type:complete
MAATFKPFFIPQKEVDLFDALNEELLDNIIGQYVDIYKISVEDTEENLYGESTKKYFKTGFRVNCLISFEDPTINFDEFGPDKQTNIEVFFHRTTLKEADFYPEIGDIIDWNNFYFEINSTTEPVLIGGNQDFKHEIKVLAHRIRLSSIQIVERTR